MMRETRFTSSRFCSSSAASAKATHQRHNIQCHDGQYYIAWASLQPYAEETLIAINWPGLNSSKALFHWFRIGGHDKNFTEIFLKWWNWNEFEITQGRLRSQYGYSCLWFYIASLSAKVGIPNDVWLTELLPTKKGYIFICSDFAVVSWHCWMFSLP